MKATLLAGERHALGEEVFAEVRIWEVPEAVRASNHRLKYSLALVVERICVLRYDNEAGKGDHRHLGDREFAYEFSSPEQLLAVLEGCGRMADQGRTVTLSVASRADVTRRAVAAMNGLKQGEHITFASVELLWKVLSVKRLGLLRALAGEGAVSIREAARRVGRDVKAVHSDVHALLNAGVLDQDEKGRIRFPYDQVHVDFMLTDAA